MAIAFFVAASLPEGRRGGEGISAGQLFEQFLYIEHRQYVVHPFTMNENNSAEPTSISIECNLNALSLGKFRTLSGLEAQCVHIACFLLLFRQKLQPREE